MTDTSVFPAKGEEIFIEGPAGKLQLLVAGPKENAVKKVAVICHPNPYFAGTMNNKVVTTLHRAFQALGMRTVRFNYRGVGNSEGEFERELEHYDQGVDGVEQGLGETHDTLAVLDWVSAQCPDYTLYLAGFSFGAYVSYRIAADSPYREKLAYLISITMPRYAAVYTLPEPVCPWLLVQGEDDEVVASEGVFEWVVQLKSPPKLLKMPETSHFFHGKLVQLREAIIKQLT